MEKSHGEGMETSWKNKYIRSKVSTPANVVSKTGPGKS